jgi:hypothetical protein
VFFVEALHPNEVLTAVGLTWIWHPKPARLASTMSPSTNWNLLNPFFHCGFDITQSERKRREASNHNLLFLTVPVGGEREFQFTIGPDPLPT